MTYLKAKGNPFSSQIYILTYINSWNFQMLVLLLCSKGIEYSTLKLKSFFTCSLPTEMAGYFIGKNKNKSKGSKVWQYMC